MLKIMADHFDTTLSEDQLIALLCGEFGGLSASILLDAMGTATRQNNIFDNNTNYSTGNAVSDRRVDSGEENIGHEIGFDDGVQTKGKNMAALGARAIQAPVKSDNVQIFAGNIDSLIRSAWMESAYKEALIAVIDSITIALELEPISNEGEYETNCKDLWRRRSSASLDSSQARLDWKFERPSRAVCSWMGSK